MKLPRVSYLGFILFFLWVGTASAQTPSAYKDCQDLANNESSTDVVRFDDFIGRPGDTVWMPVFVKTDSNLVGFQMLIKWDEALLSPLTTEDILIPGLFHVDYELMGEFKNLHDTVASNPVSAYEIFSMALSLNPVDTGNSNTSTIVAGFNLALPPGRDPATVPGGNGSVLFRIPFATNAGMVDGDSALVRFFAVNPAFIDSSGNPTFADCRRTELAVLWNNNIAPVTLYATSDSGFYIADNTPPPVVNEWSSTPSDTVNLGNSAILTWDVSSSDSIHMFGQGLDTVTTNPTGFLFVQASSEGAKTYTLEAWNVFDTTTVTVSFYVKTGTPGSNNAPVVSVPQNSYVIDEGETVSFQVSATDIDIGDQITLSASNLPANAAFAQAVGTGSVTSTFSFTPDFGQAGVFAISFQATDGQATGSAVVTITVNAIQFDRLFTTSAEGQAPSGGIPGKDVVLLPINMVTQQTVYGIQFDYHYDYQNFQLDSILVTPRTLDYVIYENIGQIPGEVRVVTFGLGNEPVLTDTASTAVLQMVMSIDSLAPPGDYPIQITNGWESINPDPDFPSLALVTDTGIIQVDNMGDVNLDKRVDVADAVNIVAYIIGNYGLTDRQFDVADLVLDSFVDVFDLVGVINLIYGIPLQPAPEFPYNGGTARVALNYDDMSGGTTDLLTVTSELPVDIAGVELEVAYDPNAISLGNPSLTQDAHMMNLSYRDDHNGRLKVLLHFKNPVNPSALIPEGYADLVDIPIRANSDISSGDRSTLRLSKALLSTPAAASVSVEGVDPDPQLPIAFSLHQNYPNPFNPTTTIEFQLGASNQLVRLDIFNILGRRVSTLVNSNLTSGTHTIEWDATNSMGERVASGIYLYKLQVDRHSETKKMLLLK